MPIGQLVTNRTPLRHSLRVRLPVLIALLILGLLAGFLWFAHREVEASLVRAGGARAQAAADQLASLFEQSAKQATEQMRVLAAHQDLRRYLQDPNDQTREAARQRLTKLPISPPRRIELWNDAGARVFNLSFSSTGSDGPVRDLPESSALPSPNAGTIRLQSAGADVVFSDAVLDIARDPLPGGPPTPLGRLLVRSTYSINPPGVLNQLVGADAIIAIGNKAGAPWTDLTRVVAPPPVDLWGRGVREYVSADGSTRLGAVAGIRNTPLAAWVEFPRALIVAPAGEFLKRMILLAFVVVVVVVGVVWVLTDRIMTPMRELSVAASQLAGGDYSRRVAAGRDEIGALGSAFNTMAGEIQSVYGALKKSYDQTQFALGSAHMGIWEIDLATNHVTWSNPLAAVFGMTPAQTPQNADAFFDLLHPDDRVSCRSALKEAIEQRRDEYSVECRVSWPDRSMHWLDVRARVMYGADGSPSRVLGVALDVTGRKALETRLQQSQKLEAIGQLAGGVAHDFNNLLTAILGFASLLVDSLDAEDPRRGHVQEIFKAGERGAGLTSQLLAFSRQQVLEPTLVNLNTLVTDTSQMLRRLIGAHIELVTHLSPDLSHVLADRSQLEQIVVNLAVNARDAMPGGGKLSIETANLDLDDSYALEHVVVRPGSYVMLAVSDTGSGMDEDTRRHAFEPFFTTKERGRGTGMGLATVYGIVKQSGGYIWVYSEKGRGAAFKVYLPRVEAHVDIPRPAASAPKRAVGCETLLVVEDEGPVRRLSRVILEKAGYRVIEAEDAETAERLFTDDVQLLISDVIMPGSNGPALFQKLVARRPALKVLFTSGYTDDMIAREGKLEPGTAFLQKPFSRDSLQRKVREVLDS